jgi:hypothetical protein
MVARKNSIPDPLCLGGRVGEVSRLEVRRNCLQLGSLVLSPSALHRHAPGYARAATLFAPYPPLSPPSQRRPPQLAAPSGATPLHAQLRA